MSEITGELLASSAKTMLSERGGCRGWSFGDAIVKLTVRRVGLSPDLYVYVRVSSPGIVGRSLTGIAYSDGSFSIGDECTSEEQFYSRIEHFLD